MLESEALVGKSPVHGIMPAHLCGREAEDRGGPREGTGADGGGSVWHGDAGEGGAALEGAVSNGGEASGEGDGGEGGAAAEGAVADGGEAGGEGDAGERAIEEAELSDTISFSKPEDRLLSGQVDELRTFNLRAESLFRSSQIRKSQVRGFLGGRIDLIPHQIAIVNKVASRIAPRVLLADLLKTGGAQ